MFSNSWLINVAPNVSNACQVQTADMTQRLLLCRLALYRRMLSLRRMLFGWQHMSHKTFYIAGYWWYLHRCANYSYVHPCRQRLRLLNCLVSLRFRVEDSLFMLSKEEFLEFERTTEINGENETNTSCREKMLQNTNQETITHNKTHTLCTRNSKTESINVIN